MFVNRLSGTPSRLRGMVGSVAIGLVTAAGPRPAAAEEVTRRAAETDGKTSSATSRATPESNGGWGWIVALSSIAAGAAVTVYGLTIHCGDTDTSCQRGASLAIWGGVGIASVGSIVGIAIVMDQAPADGSARLVRLSGAF